MSGNITAVSNENVKIGEKQYRTIACPVENAGSVYMHQINMVRYNELQGLIIPEVSYEAGKRVFLYNVTDFGQTLKQIAPAPAYMAAVIKNICRVIGEAAEYMLDADRFILDIDHIYLSRTDSSVPILLYYPAEEGSFTSGEAFASQILDIYGLNDENLFRENSDNTVYKKERKTPLEMLNELYRYMDRLSEQYDSGTDQTPENKERTIIMPERRSLTETYGGYMKYLSFVVCAVLCFALYIVGVKCGMNSVLCAFISAAVYALLYVIIHSCKNNLPKSLLKAIFKRKDITDITAADSYSDDWRNGYDDINIDGTKADASLLFGDSIRGALEDKDNKSAETVSLNDSFDTIAPSDSPDISRIRNESELDDTVSLEDISVADKAYLMKSSDRTVYYTVDVPIFIIGRNQSMADLYLADKTVNQIHAQIVHEDDDYYLIDKSSKNGTYINGKRIIANERVPLYGSEEIVFSREAYLFLIT